MESENLLNLFDSYWFEHGILKKQARPPNSEPNPPHKTLEISNPNLTAISTRSMDELVSSSSISSFSPNSVLLPRTLQRIFSGEEMKESLPELEVSRTEKKAVETETPKSCSGGQRRRRSRGIPQGRKDRKLKRGVSKSLSSDLEFEEIKGFMELGFVFSEEDKSSEFLATILPGLQRLGVEEEDAEEEGFMRKIVEGSGISRPYLSEAWLRRRENPPPLTMSWEELPSVNSEIDMKDYLKGWAHTVASSVK